MILRVSSILLLAGALAAQAGDKKGEAQPPLPKGLAIPDAPALSPEQALKSFTIQPGFEIELVASEPLIDDPVCMRFDAWNRLWVVEMRGFMPNVDGTHERDKVGRVVVLEDSDGDGRMDKSRVFLDELVLPRAIAIVRDGVLVIEPPTLWFWRDTDGDGRADEKTKVAGGFGAGLNSPEHAANGLMHGLDNWIYLANHGYRYRFDGHKWLRQKTPSAGQWGISQDDWGRRFFNSNSNYLYCDFYPSHYAVRNPGQGVADGVNVRIGKDNLVWPGRVNPGINRGYQKHMLRDGKLARFTAACGPVVYRGDLLPEEVRGNAFIPEPAGNLIRRAVLSENGVEVTSKNAYEKQEFLTSTDERFRPVNMNNGPDGGLYVVDFYRGIIQHRIFVTTFLRKQILERGLDKPVGLGRIYRIVPAGHRYVAPRPLGERTSAELVAALSDPNGWTRSTAQRLLVERKDAGVTKALVEVVRSASDPRARIHALWTLEGMSALTPEVVIGALSDTSARVRANAVRLLEPWLPREIAHLGAVREDSAPGVQLQLALTCGEIAGDAAIPLLADVLARNIDNRTIRSAVVSGLGGRELAFIDHLVADDAWQAESAGRRDVLKSLAEALTHPKAGAKVVGLLDCAAGCRLAWHKRALLDGIVAGLPKPKLRADSIAVAAEPKALSSLNGFHEQRDVLRDALAWPGKQRATRRDVGRPLTKSEKLMVRRGRILFLRNCMSCHQADGNGLKGTAPSLHGSKLVLGPPERQIRIVLKGIKHNAELYSQVMQGLPKLRDKDLAAILTFTRRSWGHKVEPVTAELVKRVRAEVKDRTEPYSREELEKME